MKQEGYEVGKGANRKRKRKDDNGNALSSKEHYLMEKTGTAQEQEKYIELGEEIAKHINNKDIGTKKERNTRKDKNFKKKKCVKTNSFEKVKLIAKEKVREKEDEILAQKAAEKRKDAKILERRKRNK